MLGSIISRKGISKLKQVTGREHRDVQRYSIGVIAGAAPRNFVIAICALMNFCYLAQSPIIDGRTCDRIDAALANSMLINHQSSKLTRV